jgi:heat shock protein HslJ
VVASPGAPALADLKNAAYHGIEGLAGPVTLKNGVWEGEPLVAGGAARPRLGYARDFRVTGDLDGDGAEEAVALLGFSAGGTGEAVYIAVVRRENGGTDCVATAPLGDRVKVRDARVADGRVFLDVLQAGASDAMCCPGDLVTRVWQLTTDGLVEVRATPTGRLAVSSLYGVEWVLRWWSWDEAAPAAPEVTAAFYDRRVAGKAGCNRYLATVTDGAAPGELSMTSPAATLMACPDPAGAVETRFLAQLAAVTRYSFVAGMLSLEYESNTARGTMLFERRAAPEPPPVE